MTYLELFIRAFDSYLKENYNDALMCLEKMQDKIDQEHDEHDCHLSQDGSCVCEELEELAMKVGKLQFQLKEKIIKK